MRIFLLVVLFIFAKSYYIDAIAVRDRALLGKDDRYILEYAFNDDRILVTANVVDFEKFAQLLEVHCGIVFLLREIYFVAST